MIKEKQQRRVQEALFRKSRVGIWTFSLADMLICMCNQVCVYMFVENMYVNMGIYGCIHTYLHMCVYIDMYTYICIYMNMCICITLDDVM